MDANIFSLAQATSNNSGKTSGSGTGGLYLIFIGSIVALSGTVGWLMKLPEVSTVYMFATGVIGTGAGLLGYRKSVEKTTIENGASDEFKQPSP